MLLAWVAMSIAWGAECVEPVKQAELVTAMDGAENALRELDDTGFRDGVNQVAGLYLPCVDQVVTADLSARYHRLMALHLHALGDEPGADLALASAYNLDPQTSYPDDLVPPTHPLRESWARLVPDPQKRRVPEPRFGRLGFDGEITRDRPKNRPTVVQFFDESGIATSTAYLGPREPLPSYAAVPRQRNLLLGCTGGAVALSGLTYGLAMGANGRLYANAAQPDTKAAALDKNRGSANALSVLSGTFFTIGAGCGVGAAVIGQR